MFFKRPENHEKEYLSMKEVRKYTGLSRSYLYKLKDQGILHAVEDVVSGQSRFKFLTKSVLEIAVNRGIYLEQKAKIEKEKHRITLQMRDELRRFYGS